MDRLEAAILSEPISCRTRIEDQRAQRLDAGVPESGVAAAHFSKRDPPAVVISELRIGLTSMLTSPFMPLFDEHPAKSSQPAVRPSKSFEGMTSAVASGHWTASENHAHFIDFKECLEDQIEGARALKVPFSNRTPPVPKRAIGIDVSIIRAGREWSDPCGPVALVVALRTLDHLPTEQRISFQDLGRGAAIYAPPELNCLYQSTICSPVQNTAPGFDEM
ncbi:hypothetical protein [Lichenifustis flavocetrariae]|uniref:Uncharacterized protein n=1 Tax=Lichenifustis flavocetrariae TaxID=2949735 RepID=A0AA41Z1F1_9HYPH|nr:hypothetical protein [Lichenifustis flavocetrariae]MCW6511212.1 hypothetical protein [Lichenifustis flavocetrariae]